MAKNTLGKVALGLTGVVLTTGAVAAGAALANKQNREKLASAYQAVTHTIRAATGKKRGRKKGRL